MRASLSTSLVFLASATLGLATAGCSRNPCATGAVYDSANAGTPQASAGPQEKTGAASTTDASRAIAEADIIQLDGHTLYAMSKSGSVAIVDASVPGALVLKGKAAVAGEPFEMYRRGNVLLTMSNGAVAPDGIIRPADDKGAATTQDNDGAVITALDVSDPANVRPLAQFVVHGEIADSRMVGDALYVATYENGACYGCTTKPRTMVTSFDAKDPTALRKVEELSFESNAPASYDLAWGMAWKRSIFATDQRLYVGGHADFDTTGQGVASEGILDVVDISDPNGKMTRGARLALPGAVLSRWQMDESSGVLRVITQKGAGYTGNGVGSPSVDTFKVDSATSITALGHASILLPRQEGLRTVRFDGPRAYAITFNQTDPLFAIDLADPAHPKQRGELKMPGWMFYLEPHGDRVIGLGVDRTDPGGSLNVSLFDVSNMDAPKMLSRVPFGAKDLGEDYQILNYEVPEDQDRIQKAFRVFADGIVAVPYSGTSAYSGDTCASATGGVQLLSWKGDTLTKQALLSMKGNPRRAFELDAQMIAVSDSNVSAFSLASGASTKVLSPSADVAIGTCVARTEPTPTYNGGNRYPNGYGGNDYAYGREAYPDAYGTCSE